VVWWEGGVSWGERVSYGRSLVSVCVKCSVLSQFWPQIHLPPNLQQDTKKDRGKTKKREREKHVISRNSENRAFL